MKKTAITIERDFLYEKIRRLVYVFGLLEGERPVSVVTTFFPLNGAWKMFIRHY